MSLSRLVLIAVVALGIGMMIGNAFVMRESGNPNQQAAQERCEQDVLGRLSSRDKATVSQMTVAPAQLESEGSDRTALGRDSLKGVDRSRISVRSVTGVVQTPGAADDPFTCRAYFVDDTLTDTQVVFEQKR